MIAIFAIIKVKVMDAIHLSPPFWTNYDMMIYSWNKYKDKYIL